MAQTGSKRIRNNVICFTVMLLGVTGAQADVPQCQNATDQAAEEVASRIHSWEAYYGWYHKYRGCEGGDSAERLVDVTEQLLGHQWPQFQTFAPQWKKDKAFLPFVVRHISSVSDGSLMTQIAYQARHHCAAGLKATCAAIAKEADYAAKGGT